MGGAWVKRKRDVGPRVLTLLTFIIEVMFTMEGEGERWVRGVVLRRSILKQNRFGLLLTLVKDIHISINVCIYI